MLTGAVRGLPSGAENLPNGRRKRSGQLGEMETCDNDSEDCLRQAYAHLPASGRSKRASSDAGRGPRSSVGQKIQEILNKNPVCPITNICNSDAWLQDDDLQYIRKDNQLFKNIIDAWMHKVCRWSIFDFQKFYTTGDCEPQFHCGYMDMNSVYYSKERSVDIINELLKFQFHGDAIKVREFLTDLYNVLERKIPKLNTIVIKSPPSAGKNYFFDMFLDYYMNRGQIGNPNKYNNFAYQEAVGKRLLIWNEPSYESSQTDTLKMLLGGDNLTVRVKMMGDAAVYRTPIIVLTNKSVPFMNDPAFENRIVKYDWCAAPFLKNYDKKPHPMTVFDLFVNWEIIIDNALYADLEEIIE